MSHIHEHIDFTVNAWIVSDGKVLLLLHKKLDMWLPPGGHIELHEDPDHAFFREVKEETGLEIEVLGSKPHDLSTNSKFLYAPQYLDIHKIDDTHRHVGLNYFARPKSGEVTLLKEESDDIRWFTEAELDDPEWNLMPEIKFYAREALKRMK